MENETIPETKVELTESQKNLEQVAKIWGCLKSFVYTCLNLMERLATQMTVYLIVIIVVFLCAKSYDESTNTLIRHTLGYSVLFMGIGQMWTVVKMMCSTDE